MRRHIAAPIISAIIAATVIAALLAACGATGSPPAPTPAPTSGPTSGPTEPPAGTPTLTPTEPPLPTSTPTETPEPTSTPAGPNLGGSSAEELRAQIAAAEAQWRASQIASYRVTLLEVHSIWSAQRLVVTVTDGHVSDIRNTCIPAPSQGATCTPQSVEPAAYAVPALFEHARGLAAQYKPEAVRLTFDPALGYPTRIVYDDPQIVDEDYGLMVESFERLPGRPAGEVGDTVTLAVGETADAAGVSVTLVRIVEDSRCPASVACAWSGQVIVELRVAAPGGQPDTVRLNLMGTGMKLEQTGQAAGRTLQLTAVSPYPATPDDDIPTERYRATVLVSR